VRLLLLVFGLLARAWQTSHWLSDKRFITNKINLLFHVVSWLNEFLILEFVLDVILVVRLTDRVLTSFLFFLARDQTRHHGSWLPIHCRIMLLHLPLVKTDFAQVCTHPFVSNGLLLLLGDLRWLFIYLILMLNKLVVLLLIILRWGGRLL
jgi:hypothetical protein